MASQDILFPDWQPVFYAALLETDPRKLKDRILSAEDVIVARMQALINDPNGEAERRALEDAVRQLRVIQVEKLNYPDWNKK